jgi:DNA-binding transcriptional LysR family regulator
MQNSERLKGVDVFVAVAQAGSFVRAAERLNLTGSAVGKAIARLEARLAVRLFERSTRRLALTEAGARFLDACTRVLGELEEAEQALHAQGDVLAGRLRIDLPVTYGRLIVLPLLTAFFQQHPLLKPVLSFTDRFVNVLDEGIDVALRIGSPEAWSPSLGHCHVAREEKVFCAAPTYIAQRGAPATIADLDRHAAIMYGKADGSVSPWLLRHNEGMVEPRAVDAQLVAGNAEAQVALTLAGLGIAQLPTWLIGPQLDDGRLVNVLPEHAVPGLPMHVVWPKAKEDVPRVRQLVAMLCAQLTIGGNEGG